jgi:hypothetical protein
VAAIAFNKPALICGKTASDVTEALFESTAATPSLPLR